MSTTVDAQVSIYEKTIEDEALEAALDRRQELRGERKDLNRKIRDAEGTVTTKIEELELGEDAPVRVGKYVLTLTRSKVTDVAFTRGGGTRLQVSLLDEG
jgi:hypothetical protein